MEMLLIAFVATLVPVLIVGAACSGRRGRAIASDGDGVWFGGGDGGGDAGDCGGDGGGCD